MCVFIIQIHNWIQRVLKQKWDFFKKNISGPVYYALPAESSGEVRSSEIEILRTLDVIS